MLKVLPMKLTVIYHYAKDDKEFISDYYSIEVFRGKKKIKSYGDYYHDKGTEKLEGFLDGIEFIIGIRPETKIIEKADGKLG